MELLAAAGRRLLLEVHLAHQTLSFGSSELLSVAVVPQMRRRKQRWEEVPRRQHPGMHSGVVQHRRRDWI